MASENTTRQQVVRLIRHGESAANIGAATDDPALIPLTEQGVEQARRVAQTFLKAPGLIVTSPFIRAHCTAQATAGLFPETAVQVWPIHEFTYLEPSRCANTTAQERRAWVQAYWRTADPDYRDGPGAETFREFTQRARDFLDALGSCPRDVAVFSHGQFINAVAWLLEGKAESVAQGCMLDYRAYELSNPVANCSGYQIHRTTNGSDWQLGRQRERLAAC
ncbi:putative phosphoserine phosphatase 2 [compost metagenome]|uniref:histidine phosphatase family protein n=1 Tax=Pseudomonas TaxID=286 RepID=UPI000FA509C2|nr:histidine phosphatase family protein [Pseudomonas sp. MYb187]